MKRYSVDVLETWHRTGIVYAGSIEEVASVILGSKEDPNRIFWDEAEYIAERYDNPEYLIITEEPKDGEREEVYRGDGRDLVNEHS